MAANENIQVSLRFRPTNQREQDENDPLIWYHGKNNVTLKQDYFERLADEKRAPVSNKVFSYDHVYTGKHANEAVYLKSVKHVVTSSLEGYNGTVFAYGQTGSGKTFTMMGSDGAELDRLIAEKEVKIAQRSGRKKTGKRGGAENRSMQSVSPIRTPVSTGSPATPQTPVRKDSLSGTQQTKAPGIIHFALETLFRLMAENTEKRFNLVCSYMEIYNENVFDLLAERNQLKKEKLMIQEDKVTGFYVKGLSDHSADCMEDILALIQKGEENRHYAATAMNHHSSRSHTIFRLNLSCITTISTKEMKERLREENESDSDSEYGSDDSENEITTTSLLNFVDLAGSERVANLAEMVNPFDTVINSEPVKKPSLKVKKPPTMIKNNKFDTLLNEGRHINTSLFYLCQVISKLAEQRKGNYDGHIPYRNSSLTKLLRSSLGGNAKTCIICTANPTFSQYEMTLSTLRFAGTAITITNAVAVNIKSDKNAELLAAYQKDIDVLRRELETAHRSKQSNSESSQMAKLALEDKIRKLTQMLINQRKDAPTETKTQQKQLFDLWIATAGDLHVDARMISERNMNKILVPGTHQLKFDERAQFALERMKIMNRERVKKDNTINDLNVNVKYLKDSKMNLNTELKKIIQHRSQIDAERRSLQQTLDQEREQHANQVAQLTIFENPNGLAELEGNELEELERYLFRAIDTVKDVRIRKMLDQKGSLKAFEGRGLFEILGLSPEKSILDETTNEDDKCVIETNMESSLQRKHSELNGKPRTDEEVKERNKKANRPQEEVKETRKSASHVSDDTTVIDL